MCAGTAITSKTNPKPEAVLIKKKVENLVWMRAKANAGVGVEVSGSGAQILAGSPRPSAVRVGHARLHPWGCVGAPLCCTEKGKRMS